MNPTFGASILSWIPPMWTPEAGLFAIRSERDYCIEEDFMKAVRKIAENKKLETKLDYKPV